MSHYFVFLDIPLELPHVLLHNYQLETNYSKLFYLLKLQEGFNLVDTKTYRVRTEKQYTIGIACVADQLQRNKSTLNGNNQ
ncbi:hypothetical protein DID88_003967 [Monilinia fructigena]|uniref:Uncharacterized protein n=1 Tax=Monilinia fructigena TaxID=38457 RepID=A0A395IDZ8_9HELO|nr:hypothetical protein DID88_003967 [Monilinia fructigena]